MAHTGRPHGQHHPRGTGTELRRDGISPQRLQHRGMRGQALRPHVPGTALDLGRVRFHRPFAAAANPSSREQPPGGRLGAAAKGLPVSRPIGRVLRLQCSAMRAARIRISHSARGVETAHARWAEEPEEKPVPPVHRRTVGIAGRWMGGGLGAHTASTIDGAALIPGSAWSSRGAHAPGRPPAPPSGRPCSPEELAEIWP